MGSWQRSFRDGLRRTDVGHHCAGDWGLGWGWGWGWRSLGLAPRRAPRGDPCGYGDSDENDPRCLHGYFDPSESSGPGFDPPSATLA
jgi:hypothetical protein